MEAALNLSGKEGVLALLALKRTTHVPPSSLLPPGGLPLLTDAAIPQRYAPLPERQALLDRGAALRSTALFASLSVGEAAVLGSLLQRQQAAPGDVIIHRGDPADALYLIEAGRVETRRQLPDGRSVALAILGAGDLFGEITLITGKRQTADVVALDDVRLLRLSSDVYRRYVSQLVDLVDGKPQARVTVARRSANVQHAVSDATTGEKAFAKKKKKRAS
jgi:signal-transduction protein with cAMP-binding, CBS, and nucleotidyltransferase domain